MSAGVAARRAPNVASGPSPAVPPLHVLKFGSSVLVDADQYGQVADAIVVRVARNRKVVAVVSAMGDTTDRLMAAARAVASIPPDAQLAALLATGEEASVALLVMALASRGASVRGFTASSLPVRTRGALANADPVHVDAQRIRRALVDADVVVLPGFVGIDVTGTPSLLGRGGSDLTALFVAHALGAAQVCLVKDVDGIHAHDPRRHEGFPPLRRLGWDQVRRIGGGVVQEKALCFAAHHGLAFRVASLHGRGTWVHGTAAEALA